MVVLPPPAFGKHLDFHERLLESHYAGAITVHELRHLAMWDPLRDHPRFQALLEKKRQGAE